MTESTYKVHRVRFVELQPKSIHSLAYGKGSKLLALSREDGSIELRDPEDYWAYVLHIPGQDGRSIESLVWIDMTLYSAGLTGEILEWNLAKCEPQNSYDSCGGPVWCLRASHSQLFLAAGCEDGSVRLFEIVSMGLCYAKHLDKQESRVLSVAWSADDSELVTGSSDGKICLYNVKTGHVISRISAVRKNSRPAIVWSVHFLSNMTIVSGDSYGNVQFWDSNTGTLMQAFNSHTADVLAICVSDDEQSVFASGVDSKVAMFVCAPGEHGRVWIRSKEIKANDYDTRALAFKGGDRPCLVSGGVDPRLIVHDLQYFNSKSASRFSCFPRYGACQLAAKACLLACHEQHVIHVWKLVQPLPQKVVEFKAKGTSHIKCFTISESGSYFAYSSADGASIYQVLCDSGAWSVRKVKANLRRVASLLCFCGEDSQFLVLADQAGDMFAYNILDGTCAREILLPSIPNKSLPYKWLVAKGDLVAVFDARNRGHVIDVAGCAYRCCVPSLSSHVVYAAFRPNATSIMMLTAAHDMYEFDYAKETFLPWCLSVNSSRLLVRAAPMSDPISKLVFNPCNPEEMFLLNTKKIGKVMYGASMDDVDLDQKYLQGMWKYDSMGPVKFTHRYSDILFFDFTSAGDMVVVERLMDDILRKLPPRLKVKKFGY